MALPAVLALTSPCLKGSTWHKYEAWPYLFILIAILATQLIDALLRGYFMRRQGAAGAQLEAALHPPTGGCGHTMMIGALTAPPSQAPHEHAHGGQNHNHSHAKGGSQHSKDEESGSAEGGALG